MGIVQVAAVKAFLRLEQDVEDGVIAGLIATAEAYGERFTGRAFVAREIVETAPVDGRWHRLSLAPVTAILAVSELPAAGAAFALPVDGYAIDIDGAGDGRVRVTRPGAAGRAEIRYRAGMAGDAAAVPAPIAQGVVRMAAHLFTHRDAADDGGPPAAVAALWRPYRRMRLS